MSVLADSVEGGSFGRLAVVRLRPNVDLVEGIEAVCAEQGFARAAVRGAVGSLTQATLARGDGRPRSVAGPGLEIALTAGEVRPDRAGGSRARVYGLVCDAAGQVYGGEFVRGANPIFVTLELVVQEWLPEDGPS